MRASRRGAVWRRAVRRGVCKRGHPAVPLHVAPPEAVCSVPPAASQASPADGRWEEPCGGAARPPGQQRTEMIWHVLKVSMIFSRSMVVQLQGARAPRLRLSAHAAGLLPGKVSVEQTAWQCERRVGRGATRGVNRPCAGAAGGGACGRPGHVCSRGAAHPQAVSLPCAVVKGTLPRAEQGKSYFGNPLPPLPSALPQPVEYQASSESVALLPTV
jgi:hypothetical protein